MSSGFSLRFMSFLQNAATHPLATYPIAAGRGQTVHVSGRIFAGVLASLDELELELGRERRAAVRDARRARGQSIGRPKAVNNAKPVLARRMHASGESATTTASTLGVSRATVYHVLAEDADE
jgi:DNA invertase Pin-like site-specific DNA recombinase